LLFDPWLFLILIKVPVHNCNRAPSLKSERIEPELLALNLTTVELQVFWNVGGEILDGTEPVAAESPVSQAMRELNEIAPP